MKDKFTIEELKNMVNEVNSWNGELDWLDYQENDEEFFNIYYNNPIEAVRAVCYGDYNYTDDYVKINAYGNLESCDEYEYEKEIEESADEIVDTFLRNIDNMWDDELKEKVKAKLNDN